MIYRIADLLDSLMPLAQIFGMAYLVGQAVPDIALPNVEGLTATAILGWYAWHNTRYTIPSIVKEFREELQIERKANDEILREIRAQFFQELRESRDFYKLAKHDLQQR